METLTIKKENVLKAFKKADKEGKKLLENLFPTQFFDIKEIRSFAEICRIAGKDVAQYTYPDSSHFADEEEYDEAYAKIAFAKMRLIFKVINQGWKPDWSDSNEYKYYAWMKFSAGSGFSFDVYVCTGTFTAVGSRLCTYSRDTAQFIAETFQAEYNEYFTLNS